MGHGWASVAMKEVGFSGCLRQDRVMLHYAGMNIIQNATKLIIIIPQLKIKTGRRPKKSNPGLNGLKAQL